MEDKYKHHYIYKITCLCGSFAGHYYIGKRSTKHNDMLNDFYYGSGEKLRRYYKKYPPEVGVTITKEIIEENPTKEINAKREREIIGDLYITDQFCLNRMNTEELEITYLQMCVMNSLCLYSHTLKERMRGIRNYTNLLCNILWMENMSGPGIISR